MPALRLPYAIPTPAGTSGTPAACTGEESSVPSRTGGAAECVGSGPVFVVAETANHRGDRLVGATRILPTC